jgi:hypothetical protein
MKGLLYNMIVFHHGRHFVWFARFISPFFLSCRVYIGCFLYYETCARSFMCYYSWIIIVEWFVCPVQDGLVSVGRENGACK